MKIDRRHSRNRRKKLLVIPHEFGTDMRIRGIEYARHLSSRFDVYCQAWPDMIQASPDGGRVSVRERLRRGTQALNPRVRVESIEPHFHHVWAPILQPALIRRLVGRIAAFETARRINHLFLKRLVRMLAPDVILLSNGLIYPVEASSARVFFDWYDWFDESKHSDADKQREARYVARIQRAVQGHIAVSKPLREKLRHQYGVQADYYPNGVDLRRFRSVSASRVKSLRKELGLGDRYVIGCVGNHGAGSGLDFLLEVFADVRTRMPDSTLLVVGPAPGMGDLTASGDRPGVRWVNRVAPEDVPAYIYAMDLAVLPKRKNSMSDMAFHLKGVEYTACRKVFVSNRLASVVDLRWPHVVFSEESVPAWAKAVCTARKIKWNSAWDALAEEYDWDRLADRLARWLDQ